MFVIKDRPKSPDPELIKLLKDVEPATVGHFRHYGFIDPDIRPVLKDTKVVGPAITVKTPGADSTVVHKVMEIAKPGDVLVVDRCGDREHACWGGMVTLSAHLKGLAGGIIDGPATDVDEIEALKFPLYCRGLSAMTTKLLGLGGEINTVVQCGGVTVEPGDLIVADRNGIVVLKPNEAREVALKALAMQEAEKGLEKELRKGKSLSSLSKANAIIAESQKAG
ncbi:MAG: RraA family protein [Desulfobacteraceae bacterium]|jgi:regulator of RNase E activity RraA|nr:RraA family protein [Desulfobacteraceae bacterium]